MVVYISFISQNNFLLKFVCVFTCMYVWYMYMFMCAQVCALACGGQRLVSAVFLAHLPPYF